MRSFRLTWLYPIILTVVLCPPSARASALGGLAGTVSDQDGQPLGNLVVSLIAKTARESLPILTRTDESGGLTFNNIKVGIYELSVLSAAYQSPVGRLVQIEEGKILGIRLVLQQLIGLGMSDEQNVGLKSLLRSSSDRRLIFRTSPGQLGGDEERGRQFFDQVFFQVNTNTGWGSESLGPRAALGGTTTNFAVKENIGGNDYAVAGQIHSGQDSLWRIKNFFDYQLGDQHTLQVFFGYGQLSYDQPSLSLLENAGGLGEVGDYLPAGTTRILSLGLSDRWNLADALSIVWGLELNQVRSGYSSYYANPSAEIEFAPLKGTRLRALLASKRATLSNLVSLPDEETMNLADAVNVVYPGGHSSVARERHYLASIVQTLDEDTEVEMAAYRNQMFGAAPTLMTVSFGGNPVEATQLSEAQAQTQGYRFSLIRQFGSNVTATFSYLRSQAMGLDGEATLLVERSALQTLFRRQGYHSLATQLDAFIPVSNTRLTALFKTVPSGQPIISLDAFSDVLETPNQSVNLFFRQLVPVPASLLGFLGLDFLSGYKIEALLDIRNLTNENLALVQTAQGQLALIQQPRSVRGGIALNF